MTRPDTLLRPLVCAAAAAVILAGCGSSGDAKDSGAKDSGAKGSVATAEPSIRITNFQFTPPTLTVKPGTTVKWTNGDTAIHSVKDTSPLATPVSQDLANGATFSIKYDRPGSYPYICGIHQYMTGSVTVAP